MRIVAFFTVLLAAIPAQAEIIYHEGWEDGVSTSGGMAATDSYCCDHSLNAVGAITSEASGETVTPYEGSSMLRALVRSGDIAVQGHRARAELSGLNNPGFFPYRTDRWIGFSHYIAAPAGYTMRNFGVFQWHSQAWHNPGGEEGPPFYLRSDGGPDHEWVTDYRWKVTNSEGGGEQVICNWEDNDMLNRWNHIVIHVNIDDRSHDAGGLGVLEVWVNGVQLVDEDEYQEMHGGYGEEWGDFYFKIGADLSSWPPTGPNYPLERFIDSFRIGDEHSSYEEVDPTRGEVSACDVSHLESCFSLDACTSAGGIWCPESSPMCRASSCDESEADGDGDADSDGDGDGDADSDGDGDGDADSDGDGDGDADGDEVCPVCPDGGSCSISGRGQHDMIAFWVLLSILCIIRRRL